MMNAGKYRHKISIYQEVIHTDDSGFKTVTDELVITTHAQVKTTKGMTLIKSGTDFEQAYTNFTIRYPVTPINRDMRIHYNDRIYIIEYINNINELNIELEIQAKEITH